MHGTRPRWWTCLRHVLTSGHQPTGEPPMDKQAAQLMPDQGGSMSAMDRRSFIKVTGAAAAAASTGLAGVLESGRAPAYAQGARLHLVRWVDFVPASDEALK